MGFFGTIFGKLKTSNGASPFMPKELFDMLSNGLGIDYRGADIEKLYLYYLVASIRGEAFSKVQFKLQNKKSGEIITEHEILDRIYQPNVIQTFKEFIIQYSFNLTTYGTAKMYLADTLSNRSPEDTYMFNIPEGRLEYPKVGFFDMIKTHKDPFKELEIKYVDESGSFKTISFADMVVTWDDTQKGNNFLGGTSKFKASQIIYSTAQIRLEADNVLTGKPGGLGILSPDGGKNAGIPTPFLKGEKDEIQQQFRKYGVAKDKLQVIFATNAKKWLPLPQVLKDWEFDKNTQKDLLLAGLMMKIPKELLGQDATFENQEKAEIRYYQGDPKSTMESYINSVLRSFGLDKEFVGIASYDHLPIMQGVKNQQADYNKKLVELANSLMEHDESKAKQIIESITI